jgi:hypothetical protein
MNSQIAAALLALLAVSWAGAEDVRDVPPTDCVPGLRDHTFLWWAHGWRSRSPQGQQIRCVQTGHYGLAMDVEKATILHLGPIAKASAYEDEVGQGNEAVFSLPPADLGLTIRLGDRTYRCTGTSSRELGVPSPGRLVESGRFVQRADIKHLRFVDEGGDVLPCRARFETVAWPDTLVLRFEASPAAFNLPLKAGLAPGRLGKGMAFDGTSYLEFPDAPGLESEDLTAELWVYVPEGALARNAEAWILCKDGNEWDLGNYGFHLAEDRIDVSLNTGGGRENCLWLSAEERLREDRWTHLAMTYDGAKLRLYVDGRLSAGKDVNKRRAPGNRPLALGRRQDNSGHGYHFTGVLDEVRIYGRALSDQEIASHAAEPQKVGADPALAGHWSFDDPPGEKAPAPAGDWKDASLAIELTYGGRHYSARTDADADAVWKIGEPHTVVLALKPAEPQAKVEPPVGAGGVEATDAHTGKALDVTWDPLCARYTVDVPKLTQWPPDNDFADRISLRLSNPTDHEVVVPLCFTQNPADAPVGMSPMLRDSRGNPTGLPVQLTKNWHGRPSGAPYNGCWFHGLTMLRLPARSRTQVEFDLVRAMWGGLPAVSHAQLCLLGWGTDQLWDQVALGSWGESICYEMDACQRACMIDDVRPLMVNGMGGRKWQWTGNVGGGDFLVYHDAAGQRQFLSRMKVAYQSHCPNLSEVTYAGVTADGNIAARITVSTPRVDDYPRHFHHTRYDVLKPTAFKRLAFYQIGADQYNDTVFDKMARGNLGGMVEEWRIEKGTQQYERVGLRAPGPVAWFSMHATQPNAYEGRKWASRGVIVRSWKARLGGQEVATPYYSVYGAPPSAIVELSPPASVQTLQPGDFVDTEVEYVVLPLSAGEYYGPNTNLGAALQTAADSWKMVLREAVGNNLKIEARAGRVVHNYPIVVAVDEHQVADFTVTGGLGYAPVTFTGLKQHAGYELWQTADGKRAKVDQSVHGRDFWQTDYDPATRTYRRTYNVPLDSPGDLPRAVRFEFGPAR